MTLALRKLANVELLEYKSLILSAPGDVAKTQDRIRHITSKPEGIETKLPSSFLLQETESTQSQSRFFQQVPRELLAKVAGYTNEEVGSDTAERYLNSLMQAPQI